MTTTKDRIPKFLLATRFLDDPKILYLQTKFGPDAVLFLLKIWLTIAESSKAQLDEDFMDSIALHRQVENYNNLKNYLLKQELIFISDSIVSHPVITNDLKQLKKKRDKWRERQQKRRDGGCDKERDTSVTKGVMSRDCLNTEHLTLNTEDLDLKRGSPEGGISEPKTPKPKFNPEGKTKYLDWVYLSDADAVELRTYYESRGCDADDLHEAIRALDTWFENNPKMRISRTDDAKTLKGWPLDEALKRRASLVRKYKMEAPR